ncbi:MAG: hydroxyectoine utilization dehydratase EutB [Sneathiella sp.]|mgnify:FL=1|uniref:hydroxyectoine utilization dehydratase EutB n=1 Tax=Sneathiella sp. TaxID=1964365 RepID=UPI000C357C62|nr:hydroxyectoine utilization dehydratase EutB [Sneathiella sp.]MAZ01527.1 hydroxyectoine utilization dehydratase EutB [Sneathiella sp.]
MSDAITIDDIRQARQRIAGMIRETPLVHSAALSSATGREIYLKYEHLQITGSFKLRGATNAIRSLSSDAREKGVIGVSTGNHGRGLAHAAQQMDTRCIICMSELVPSNKVEAIRGEGAEIVITGRSQDEAQKEVDRRVEEDGMTMLPPFDHADVIAGQGTLALEMLEDLPELGTVIVPLSGGGLIAGIALAMKSVNPDIRVVGVSMERGAAMIESLRAGKPVEVAELPTLADSLGGGIGLANRYTFDIVKRHVDEVITLTEAEIADAIRHAYWQERQVIEGSGSVGIGALLTEKVRPQGPTVALLSGCNIDMALHKRIIDGENVDLEAETTGGDAVNA